MACYREERSWLEAQAGLGSMGFVLVAGKDTPCLYSKEDLVWFVGWVGGQGLTVEKVLGARGTWDPFVFQ